MTVEPAPDARRLPARFGRRAVLVVAAVALVLLAAGAVLAVFRYLPAVDDARALRADLETMVDRVRETGMEIDGGTIDALDADLRSARERLDRLESLLASDPLVALGRVLPPTAPSVVGADLVVTAAGDLLGAVGEGLAIGRRFVEVREAQATDPAGGSILSRLVELMATSRDRAVSAATSVASARRALDAVPDGAVSQVVSVRDAMMERIDAYGPLLDSYVDASDTDAGDPRLGRAATLPGPHPGPRGDPADGRASSGATGSWTIDRGRIIERSFQDVAPLDFPWDYPRIEPPRALADYLLGPEQPWQFADANWSPDYPTSASDALRLYANQTGDSRFDGVIAITTYTIDELLKVTGPVTVPDYDVDDRARRDDAQDPAADAGRVDAGRGPQGHPARLRGRPPRRPPRPAARSVARPSRDRGHAPPGPPPPRLVPRSGRPGACRAERLRRGRPPATRATTSTRSTTNVAPATKLDYLATRSWDLDVQIDAVGNARNTPRGHLAQRGRGARVGSLPGDVEHRGAAPGDVLPAPRPGAQPCRGGRRWGARARDRARDRRVGGRADGDRHVPQDPARRARACATHGRARTRPTRTKPVASTGSPSRSSRACVPGRSRCASGCRRATGSRRRARS